MRYLCRTREVKPNWYPEDLQQQAVVNQTIDWYHNFLRPGCSGQVFKGFMGPNFFGIKFPENEIKYAKYLFKRSAKYMESLLEKHPYLCGDQPTIPDLMTVCELKQMDYIEFDFSKWPLVKEYIERMLKIPEVNEVHSFMDKSVAKLREKKMIAKL